MSLDLCSFKMNLNKNIYYFYTIFLKYLIDIEVSGVITLIYWNDILIFINITIKI